MYVKPAPGKLIRDPETNRLLAASAIECSKPVTVVPSDGMKVDDNNFFWLRRVRDGDAVIVKVPVAASKTSAPAASTSATAASTPGS